MSGSTAFSSPRSTMFAKHPQSMGTLSPEGPNSAYASSEGGDPHQPSPSYSQLSFPGNAHTPQLGAAASLPVVYEMDSTSTPHELASSDMPGSASPNPAGIQQGYAAPASPPQNPQYMQAPPPPHHSRGSSFDTPLTSPSHPPPPPASPLVSDSDAGSQYGSPVGSPRMPPSGILPQNGGYTSLAGDFGGGHSDNQGYKPYNASRE